MRLASVRSAAALATFVHFGAAVVASCSTNDAPPASGDALGVACSTGPGQDAASVLVHEEIPDATTKVCTPRCESDAARVGISYRVDALPSGECKVDGDSCVMSVHRPCPCDDDGPNDMMWCECRSGSWACMTGTVARSICRRCDSPPEDSGADTDIPDAPAFD
jgi:hypothetical protein